MKKYLVCLLLLFIVFLYGTDVQAQCAMCRSSLESNVSSGDVEVSAQLNMGILYLLATPYVLFSLLAYFWYRTSKKNGRRLTIPGFLKS